MNERPVILALDQAEHSGFAMHNGRAVCEWGLAKSAHDRGAAISEAFALRDKHEARLLVFYEDHSEIPAKVRWPTPVILGMGDARGRWLEQLELLGHPRSWVVGVTMKAWRARTIGTHGGTDAIKGRAVRFASALVKTAVEDHNTAEAIVIAQWAALDGVARFFAAREMAKAKRRKAGS